MQDVARRPGALWSPPDRHCWDREATAAADAGLVVPDQPVCRRGTPSATSRLINAQSCAEITHLICLGGLVVAGLSAVLTVKLAAQTVVVFWQTPSHP
jgi:hypothetical protein